MKVFRVAGCCLYFLRTRAREALQARDVQAATAGGRVFGRGSEGLQAPKIYFFSQFAMSIIDSSEFAIQIRAEQRGNSLVSTTSVPSGTCRL